MHKVKTNIIELYGMSGSEFFRVGSGNFNGVALKIILKQDSNNEFEWVDQFGEDEEKDLYWKAVNGSQSAAAELFEMCNDRGYDGHEWGWLEVWEV
jgi:hypothetical protein